MAKKPLKTKDPLVFGKWGERKALDLCRINTDRLRALDQDQLETAQYRIGVLYNIPKRDNKSFRYLLSAFMNSLANAKRPVRVTPYHPSSVSDEELPEWRKQDREHQIRVKKMYAKNAVEYEAKIWQLQERAGCKLRGEEIVARDAEREGKPEIAARIRREARRPPTPHRRPAKIR